MSQKIRNSVTRREAEVLKDLQNKLFRHVCDANLSGTMLLPQIAFVGHKIGLYHHPSLEVFARRLNELVQKMRFKDLDRYCFALADSDYKSPAAETLLQTIRRRISHESSVINSLYYPHVIGCILSMLHYGVVDHHLIAWVLDRRNTPFFRTTATYFVSICMQKLTWAMNI